MSRRFEPHELPAAIAERGSAAFLVSIGDTRPHVVSVAVEVLTDPVRLRVGAGRSTPANVAARPTVTLLWPAAGTDPDHSLVVDGDAETDPDGTTVTIVPHGGVLHTTEPSGPDRRC